MAFVYPPLVELLPQSRHSPSELRLVYLDGRGILRRALAECSRRGFAISEVPIKHDGRRAGNGSSSSRITVDLELSGRGSIAELAAELDDIEGVLDVRGADVNEIDVE